MAIKTFTPGEQLFAEDLNNNFTEINITASQNAGNITTIQNDISQLEQPTITTLDGTGTVNLNLAAGQLASQTLTGNVSYTTSNLAAGRSLTVRVVGGGSQYDLTFPSSWTFLGIKPSSLVAGKVGLLSLTAFGPSDSDVVAAWAFEL